MEQEREYAMRRYRNCYEPDGDYPEWMYTAAKCVIYGPFVLAFAVLMLFVAFLFVGTMLMSLGF